MDENAKDKRGIPEIVIDNYGILKVQSDYPEQLTNLFGVDNKEAANELLGMCFKMAEPLPNSVGVAVGILTMIAALKPDDVLQALLATQMSCLKANLAGLYLDQQYARSLKERREYKKHLRLTKHLGDELSTAYACLKHERVN